MNADTAPELRGARAAACPGGVDLEPSPWTTFLVKLNVGQSTGLIPELAVSCMSVTSPSETNKTNATTQEQARWKTPGRSQILRCFKPSLGGGLSAFKDGQDELFGHLFIDRGCSRRWSASSVQVWRCLRSRFHWVRASANVFRSNVHVGWTVFAAFHFGCGISFTVYQHLQYTGAHLCSSSDDQQCSEQQDSSGGEAVCVATCLPSCWHWWCNG